MRRATPSQTSLDSPFFLCRGADAGAGAMDKPESVYREEDDDDDEEGDEEEEGEGRYRCALAVWLSPRSR